MTGLRSSTGRGPCDRLWPASKVSWHAAVVSATPTTRATLREQGDRAWLANGVTRSIVADDTGFVNLDVRAPAAAHARSCARARSDRRPGATRRPGFFRGGVGLPGRLVGDRGVRQILVSNPSGPTECTAGVHRDRNGSSTVSPVEGRTQVTRSAITLPSDRDLDFVAGHLGGSGRCREAM
jgi:hypothetical protein